MGLAAKSYAEAGLSMTLGAWLVFTESYGKILDAALVGPQDEVNIEWVDDAFFGYICSAKDALGQLTSVITSSVGAGLVGAHNAKRRGNSIDEGQRLLDDGFTASVTIILNGVNAFLYQLVLAPLYIQISVQKTVVCTTNDIMAILDVTGTKIRLGKPDLQRASDVAAGVCVSVFLERLHNGIKEANSEVRANFDRQIPGHYSSPSHHAYPPANDCTFSWLLCFVRGPLLME